LALLKALGASEGGRSGARRGAGRVGRHATREARFSDEGSVIGMSELVDPPGSLGAKLQELGRRLLQVRVWEARAAKLRSEQHALYAFWGNVTSAQLQHVIAEVVYFTGRQVYCTSQIMLPIHSGCDGAGFHPRARQGSR